MNRPMKTRSLAAQRVGTRAKCPGGWSPASRRFWAFSPARTQRSMRALYPLNCKANYDVADRRHASGFQGHGRATVRIDDIAICALQLARGHDTYRDYRPD